MAFSDFIRNLLVGTPWGDTFPSRPPAPPPVRDGRTAALTILQRYISELTFLRVGDAHEPVIPFQVPIDRIFIEWPDNEEQIKLMPRIALLSGGDVEYEGVGMGNWVDEKSTNVFAKNTMIQVQAQTVETIFIDIICATKQERRAILDGIITSLNPTEFMAGVRFKMPDYYNEVVTFVVMKKQILEDEDSARGRRVGRIHVQMYFHQVALVNAEPLIPEMTVLTDYDPDAVDGDVVLYVPAGDEDENADEIADGLPTGSDEAS